MMVQAPAHKSVMATEILEAFHEQKVIVDTTFGAGGHSRMLLAADCERTVYAMDQDAHVVPYARALERDYPDRLVFIQGNFGGMVDALANLGVKTVDGVLMDVGVSSMQLDTPEWGFSFQHDGPLLMRMAQEGLSAEGVINDYSAAELVRIIRHLGEEKMAAKIVQNICRHREKKRIRTTAELAAIIREVKQRRGARIDPATQTFQAIRMHVNDELGALERGLQGAEAILRPGGVLAVLSFHSLEDRLVKRFLQARIQQPQGSRHLPPRELPEPIFELVNRSVIKASTDELAQNPRARSAKLRLARKTHAGEGTC